MSSFYAYSDMPSSNLMIPQQPPRIYRLEVAQQPIRARMCGFGEKDRRPIDPPPVLRLIVTTPDGKPIPVSSVDHSMFAVHAGLWSNNRKKERNLVINPSSMAAHSTGTSSSVLSWSPTCTRNLMGSLTSSAYCLFNDHGQRGIYFIFHDLSVRTEGTFTLKFQFADISQLIRCGGHQSQVRVEAEVFSESFTVYAAKKFPGMTESTDLSKAFAKQGIKIPIRKERRYSRPFLDDYQDGENPHPETTSLFSNEDPNL
ncbi:4335_t:CDS:2 [Paraglomus occultum]|uniref:4335_t:CDS:1 n=1 Tax=Paraglomus occultum TaxID=144539 RepID=A0A9N9APC4_9GLOM|nr:4335_t:CDS:2 [Paraglomus occultum]